MNRATVISNEPSAVSFLAKLQSIKIGGGTPGKIRRRDLSAILSHLSILIGNGVSLPKALGTLERERGLRRHAAMLGELRRAVENGKPFSAALADYPQAFTDLMINQIRIGERSGTMAETLLKISTHLEKANQLRGKILKRLSYPLIVSAAGAMVITFMLFFIVPVFEETYRKGKIPLPFCTELLIWIGAFVKSYGFIVPIAIVLGFVGIRQLRKNSAIAAAIDSKLLKLPLIGTWIRDMAVLQFIEVLGTMLESGFKLIDALGVSISSIGNRAVRQGVEELRDAILRGEKLSREIDRHGDLFPPIVSQLVIVGEQTGNLPKSTRSIQEHLQKEVERKAEVLVGALEPILTICLAAGIGAILLAIYMPMFGMADAVTK